MNRFILTLYISGQTSRSESAVNNIRSICEEFLQRNYDLSIIDVLETPHIAEEDRILATPTLIRKMPLPVRRIIGDLSDRNKVLFGLGFQFSSGIQQGDDSHG